MLFKTSSDSSYNTLNYKIISDLILKFLIENDRAFFQLHLTYDFKLSYYFSSTFAGTFISDMRVNEIN